MSNTPLVYSDETIYIERHESEIPWLKVFTQHRHKEFSECSQVEKQAIWDALDVIEKSMIEYYRPDKINIASFGNMLPQVHWHIMARFEQDSFFPEPMWGTPRRQSTIQYQHLIHLSRSCKSGFEQSLYPRQYDLCIVDHFRT